MNKLIGLCGFAGVGKDTAAAHMPGWRRFAFADALKDDLRPLLEDVGCDLDRSDHKEQAKNLMVAWGATARAFQSDYWIDRLFREVARWENLSPFPRHAVITDVRYPNEVMEIRRRGGIVVRINRPGFSARNAEERESIRQIFGLPEVVNDGAPEDLARRILEVAGC